MQKPYTVKMLLADAEKAGLRVVRVSERFDLPVCITSTGSDPASITVWDDNSITRADVSLDVATRMTPRQGAAALRLNIEANA